MVLSTTRPVHIRHMDHHDRTGWFTGDETPTRTGVYETAALQNNRAILLLGRSYVARVWLTLGLPLYSEPALHRVDRGGD